MATRWVDAEAIGSYFEAPSDPRHTGNRKRRLTDLVVIAVRGMACGCGGPAATRRRASNRRGWLERFLAPPVGTPSRDRTRRLVVALRPAAFRKRFQERVAHAVTPDGGRPDRLIAAGGKTDRRAHDRAAGLGPLHVVSAWAGEEGVAPGRVAAEAKSDEITAIPLLPGQAGLTDALATVDAMGCREEIARDVVAGGGDSVVAVEGNRPTPRGAVEADFAHHPGRDLADPRYRSCGTSEPGHGRLDERSYSLTRIAAGFAPEEGRPWVKAVGHPLRVARHADGHETDETRFYALGRRLSGKRSSEAARGRRGVGSMHRVLDVNLREDDGRTRERTPGNDLSWLRRFAATLLRRHPVEDSLRGKTIRCMTDTAFLTEVLT